jgi:hypothetical protein
MGPDDENAAGAFPQGPPGGASERGELMPSFKTPSPGTSRRCLFQAKIPVIPAWSTLPPISRGSME